MSEDTMFPTLTWSMVYGVFIWVHAYYVRMRHNIQNMSTDTMLPTLTRFMVYGVLIWVHVYYVRLRHNI